MLLLVMVVAACRRASDDPLVASRLSLSAPGVVRAGTTAEFILTVTNASLRSISLPVADDAYTFDVIVRKRGGELVWRNPATGSTASAGKYFLASGEQVTFRAGWGLRDANGHPVAPGEYTVEGQLLAPNGASITAPEMPVMHVTPE
jgi:hypothetical protein